MNKKFMSFVLAMVLSVGLGVSTLFAYSYSKYGKEFSSYYSGSTSSKSVTIKVGSPDDMLSGNLTAVFGYYAGSLVSYQAAGGQFQLYDSYGARFTCNNDGGIWSVTGVNLRGSDLNELLKHDSMESFLMDMGFTEASLAVTEMDSDGNIMTTKTYGKDGYYGTGTISKEQYDKLSDEDKKKFGSSEKYKEDGYHNAAGKTITEEEYNNLSKEDKKKFTKHSEGDVYYKADKGMISADVYNKLSAEAKDAFTYHKKGDKKAVKDLTEEEVKSGYEISKTKISGNLYSKLIETLSSGVNFSASIQIGSGVTGPSLTISENGKPQITYTSDPTTGGIRPTQLYVYDDKGFQIGMQTATFELDSTENGTASGHWTCNYTAITYDQNGVRTDTAYQFYSWSDDPVATINSGELLNEIPAEVRYGADGYYDDKGNMKTEEEWKKLSDEDKAKYSYKSKGTVNEDDLKKYMKENGMSEFKGQISSVTRYSANNTAISSYDYTTNQTTYFANNRPSYIVNAEGTTVGLYSYSENGVITAFFNANGTDQNGEKVGTTTIFDQWGRQLFTAVGGLNDGANPFKNQAARQDLINEYNDMIANGNVDPSKYKYNSETGAYEAIPGTGTRISSISIYADQMFDKNSANYAALTTNGFLDMNKVNAIANAFKYSEDVNIDVSDTELADILKKFGLDINTFSIDGEFAVSDENNQRDKMEYNNNKFVKAIFDLVSAITGKSIDQLKKSGEFTVKNGQLSLRDSGKSAKKIVSYIRTAAKSGNLDVSKMLSAFGINVSSDLNSSAEADMVALYILTGALDLLSINTGFNTTGSSDSAEGAIRTAIAEISQLATDMVEDAFDSFSNSYGDKEKYTKAEKKAINKAGQKYINLATLASEVTETGAVAVRSSLLKQQRTKGNDAVSDNTNVNKVNKNNSIASEQAKLAVPTVKDAFANRNGGSIAALNSAFGGALNMNLAKLGYTGTDIVNMLTFSNGGATAVAQTTIAMSTWDGDNMPGTDGVTGSADYSDVDYESVTKTNGSVTASRKDSHIQYSVQGRTTNSDTKTCAAGYTLTNTILLGGAQAYSTQRNVVTNVYEETNIRVDVNTESDPAVEGNVVTDEDQIDEMKTNLAEALGISTDQIEYVDGVLVVKDEEGNVVDNYVAVNAASINIMDGTGFHAVEGETVIVKVDEETATKVQEQIRKGGEDSTKVMFMGDVNVDWSDKNTVGEHCLLMTMNTGYSGGFAGKDDVDTVKAEIQIACMVKAGMDADEIKADLEAKGYASKFCESGFINDAIEKADGEYGWVSKNTDENIAKLAEQGYSFKWDESKNENIQQQLENAWQLLF